MSWLVHLMRVVLIFTGVTPPKQEHEKQIALAGVALVLLTILGFVLFLRWMTGIVMSN